MKATQPGCRPTLSLPKFLLALLIGAAIGLLISLTDGGSPQQAEAATGKLSLRLVGTFNRPVYVTQPPAGGKVYVVEREGRVRVIKKGDVLTRPLFDIRSMVKSSYAEQGLLSIAFAPDFRRSRLLYAYYTEKAGNHDQVVVEMRTDKTGTSIKGTPREVLRMEDFNQSHNGGNLQFGPDGYLYIGTGDGGGQGDPNRNAQNIDSLLGKILRIDPRPSNGQPYSSPATNPFVGVEGRDEIFSFGFRNPWRFSIDPKRNLIAVGDVGQDTFEEVDIVPLNEARGGNFGWSAYEALTPFNGDQIAEDRIDPVATWMHSGDDGGCSVIGGYFVNTSALPALKGRYLYADWCRYRLRSFKYADGAVSGERIEPIGVGLVTSFGRGAKGQIWICSNEGGVYRIKQG